MCTIVELYSLFINNQAVCGRGTQWMKAYLMSVGNIALWLYCSLVGSETTSQLFKRETKRGQERVSETVTWHPKGH